MNKKTIFVLGIPVVIVLILLVLIWNKKTGNLPNLNTNQTPQAVLYYGNTCPHCKIVEDWLVQNPIVEQSNPISKKEVYQNKENAGELSQRARECQIADTSIGVPFLYDRGKCLVGDQPIIDYLKKYL